MARYERVWNSNCTFEVNGQEYTIKSHLDYNGKRFLGKVRLLRQVTLGPIGLWNVQISEDPIGNPTDLDVAKRKMSEQIAKKAEEAMNREEVQEKCND